MILYHLKESSKQDKQNLNNAISSIRSTMPNFVSQKGIESFEYHLKQIEKPAHRINENNDQIITLAECVTQIQSGMERLEKSCKELIEG